MVNMNNMWSFSQEEGKDRDLITLFILHSLDSRPKSGYDLLKEMSEKEGLIRVAETGIRSKNIYEITGTGEIALKKIRNRRPESRERLYLFKDLLMEIFGAEMFSLQGLLMEVRFAAEGIPAERRIEGMAVLEECLGKLKSLDEGKDTGSRSAL